MIINKGGLEIRAKIVRIWDQHEDEIEYLDLVAISNEYLDALCARINLSDPKIAIRGSLVPRGRGTTSYRRTVRSAFSAIINDPEQLTEIRAWTREDWIQTLMQRADALRENAERAERAVHDFKSSKDTTPKLY